MCIPRHVGDAGTTVIVPSWRRQPIKSETRCLWLARGDLGVMETAAYVLGSFLLAGAVEAVLSRAGDVGTSAVLPSQRRQQPSKWRARALWLVCGDHGVTVRAASVLGGFLFFSSVIRGYSFFGDTRSRMQLILCRPC